MPAPLPPPDKIDPAQVWQRWRPSPDDPWGRKWAAHLYRRAAFWPSREELVEAEQLGPDGTLDLLMRGRPQADETLQTLTDVGRVAAGLDDGGDQLRGWRLDAMVHGGHPPLAEMSLVWCNHFATSVAKVRSTRPIFKQT